MSWFNTGWYDGKSGNSYKTDEDGFYTRDEAERAVENGDLQRLSNGNLYDRDNGQEYWPDGTKK